MGIRTKIVATLGRERPIHAPNAQPLSDNVTYQLMVPWFVEAGVDVFRWNLSHRSANGEPEYRFLEAYRDTRHLWESQGRHVAIMGDLQGPKLRIGHFPAPPHDTVELVPGREYTLHTRHAVIGTAAEATVFYEEKPFADLARQVETGAQIWLGDGEALLEVQRVSRRAGMLTCLIRSGGEIKGGRGVTVKGASFALESFTTKDQKDLEFLLSFGAELTYVALSFVKTAEDILKVKRFLAEAYRGQGVEAQDVPSKLPGLIAKIETAEAVANIDEILDVVDGVMVARGDLGMQVGLEEVAGIQKRLIHRCNVRGKPVITATQMLDSMERHPIPTRAEVSDVYNAILDGSDAVMLSGESASGPYPLQAIKIMEEIAAQAEQDFFTLTDPEERFFKLLQEAERTLPEVQARVEQKIQQYRRRVKPASEYREEYSKLQRLLATQRTTDRVSHAACSLSVGVPVTAIVAPTTSGQTTRMVARFRPVVPIVGAAHDDATARKLTLGFGVYPVNILRDYPDNEAVFRAACDKAKDIIPSASPKGVGTSEPGKPLLQAGDLVVITAGAPLYQPGTTN